MSTAKANSAETKRPRSPVVIITGGTSGLGRAMALALLRSGARVVVAARSSDTDLIDIASTEGRRDRLLHIECDVARWTDCDKAIKQTIDRFGAVHGLVNNAGLGMQHIGNVLVGRRKRFYEVDVDLWRDAIDTNFNGAFMMAKSVAPRLIDEGWGRIVNISTSFFTMLMEGFSPYGPSKAALEAATVIWSKDLAGTGVTVNALLPGGPANTRMIPQTEVNDRTTLVQPEAMTAPIVWLMSAQSDSVTGRRIIAKEWNADRLMRELPEKIGAPAGWSGL